MNKKKFHFWYSEKMQNTVDQISLNNTGHHRNIMYANLSGVKTIYTVCSQTKKHGCTWDDIIYLGKGTFL